MGEWACLWVTGCAPLLAQQVSKADAVAQRGAVLLRSWAAVLVLQVLREYPVVWHHFGAQLAAQLPCVCNNNPHIYWPATTCSLAQNAPFAEPNIPKACQLHASSEQALNLFVN